MKRKDRKFLIVLIAAGLLMLAGIIGVFAATGSGLKYESDDYIATFNLNHLQIHLLENGRDVCGGKNTLNNEDKVTGDLVQYLGYTGEDGKQKLGNVEPGKYYKEEIAAENGQDVPVYLRMTVRKYWAVPDESRAPSDKAPELSPDLIHLSYGNDEYNSKDWILNTDESTSEQNTYYYKKQLAGNAVTEPLFDNLVIDSGIAEKKEKSRETKDGVTTVTYECRYDGYAFMIKADVQAVQTHNADDAIKSQWGIGNIREGSDGKSLVLG